MLVVRKFLLEMNWCSNLFVSTEVFNTSFGFLLCGGFTSKGEGIAQPTVQNFVSSHYVIFLGGFQGAFDENKVLQPSSSGLNRCIQSS